MTKIKSIEAWDVSIPLRIGLAHARWHHLAHRAVILRITVGDRSHSIIQGYGECIPRTYLTGETPESVMEWIRSHGPAWIGTDLSDDPSPKLRQLFTQVQKTGSIAAFAGFDLAIHDLWSQVVGRDLISLLGGSRGSEAFQWPLSAPVGLGRFQKAQVIGFFALGFRRIKLKVKSAHHWERPMGVLPQSHRASVQWILDANACLVWKDTQLLIENAIRFGVAAVEEPLVKSEVSFQQLKDLSRQTHGSLGLIVDEHLCSIKDGKYWQGTPVVRNLRLAKVGGFTGLKSHLGLIKDGNSPVMLGALVGESPLLESATRVALGLISPLFTESSFGRFILKQSPFWFRNQGLRVPLKPPITLEPQDQHCRGLGVLLDEAVVKKFHLEYLRIL